MLNEKFCLTREKKFRVKEKSNNKKVDNGRKSTVKFVRRKKEGEEIVSDSAFVCKNKLLKSENSKKKKQQQQLFPKILVVPF